MLRWILAALVAAALIPYAAQVAADATLHAPTPTPIILDRDGGFITQVGHTEGRRTEYGYWIVAPPPRVVAATIALEDRRFWRHPGIDPLAIARAAWCRLTRQGRPSGASTIAMQVARMQHPRSRTLWSKAVEAGTAVALTLRYGHAAVLAQYFRLAPYGEGSHGIGHAAWWYFGRPAADLDATQAALLAAIPQSPTHFAPRHPPSSTRASSTGAYSTWAPTTWAPNALARASLALSRTGQSTAALAATFPQKPPRRPPWIPLVLRLAARARALPPADMPILHATIDFRLQTEFSALAAAHLHDLRNFGAQQTALLVVARPGRQVLAAIGSIADAPGGDIDFLSTPRSPGSALKPFIYALAIDLGLLTPRDILLDTPGQVAGIGNADHDFLGPILPRQALANSRNVPAAALLRQIGLDTGFAYLRRLGLHRLDGQPIRFGLGMAIGTLPTTLERLVRAYAALADDGSWSDLRWLDAEPPAPPRSIASPASARLVTRFLSDPMARLPAFARYGASEYPLAVALKTGTSQGYRDAWTIAWSSQALVGAWVGRPDSAPMADISGGRSAAWLVQAVLLRLHDLGRSDLVAGDLPAPPGAAIEICADTGAPGRCAARVEEFAGDRAFRQRGAAALRILQPTPDLHVWRNPDGPPDLNRLVLRAAAAASITQVTWLVDGQPIATVAPSEPVAWPMTPGRHRFQLRLPLAPGESPACSVVVE